MTHGHLQSGYHGCDIAVRDGLVSGWLEPTPSNNQYDWLGPGFYLFEGDHERALAFAEAAASEPLRRLTARPIASPAVVGCIFSLQRCLDMTTQATNLCSGQGIPLNSPVNPLDEEVLLRGLDRAVFQVIHSKLRHFYGFDYFQAVRGAFRQGPEIAPRSGFHRDSHVQIALRDFSCVKGWFLLPGTELLSPADLAKAQTALHSVRDANPKSRRRVKAD